MLLFGFFLLLAWPFIILITACHPQHENEPMLEWKRTISSSVLSLLGRAIVFSMGFRLKVKGKLACPSEAPVLAVAPHSTFFDGIVCIVAGLCSIVSRTENISVPVLGRILRCLQPVLVSRVDPDSRKNTIVEITKRATSKGKWPQVLIFPEGTCTNRSCLITFKSGAFIPGVPVQPVLLRYPNRLDTVTWTWQGLTVKQLFFLTLCQPYTNLEIEFLPPYIPNEEEKKKPFLYASGVRKKMATALGLPVTDHTFEDCRLMISAGELTLPMEAGLVEFTKISRKLNLKWDNIRKELDGFAAVACANKGGRIGIEEFAKNLKLPVSDVLKELFALFDRNGDGTIDFREYVIGLTVLCKPANTEETIQMAFKLFDSDEDGYITREEFGGLLRSSLGVHDLDISTLFLDIDKDQSGRINYDEFREFALIHPEYAKLFTTYLEQQRYWALQEAENPSTVNAVKVSPMKAKDEDSISDKKDD
ncbi:lysophosphatidylcholine acyltransferase 2 isoform X2 [Protopterus annectens]|nr:lysophosphatidylcholine acyltransferase 2 isoform X2 [Protopterus annectens]